MFNFSKYISKYNLLCRFIFTKDKHNTNGVESTKAIKSTSQFQIKPVPVCRH